MSKSKSTTVAVKEYAFVLPTWGSPFLWGEMPTETAERVAMLQAIVKGSFEGIPTTAFVIHPMFCDNKRWNAVRQMLTSNKVRAYGNENGSNTSCPNGGTVLLNRYPGGCPHLWGDIAVVVPETVLTALGFNLDWFDAVKPEGWKPKNYPVWEFEEAEPHFEEWLASGKAYHLSTGFCFKAKFPGETRDEWKPESDDEEEDERSECEKCEKVLEESEEHRNERGDVFCERCYEHLYREEELGDCVLCDKPITDDAYGHNPAPLAEGKCCSKCNAEKVIPARLAEMTNQ